MNKKDLVEELYQGLAEWFAEILKSNSTTE